MCEEHVGSLQLEHWYSTSSVTQSTAPSQERYTHNTSADLDLQMYAAHYLGECRIGTYTTIFTYVRSYYNRESLRQRCMWSEPRITAYCTVHTWKRYRDKTSAGSYLHLYTYELFFLGHEYKSAITGKDNSYVSSHLLNVTISGQFKLGLIYGMLLLRNVINIKTRYKNETFVASHGVCHMVQAINKMYVIYSRDLGMENSFCSDKHHKQNIHTSPDS